MWTPQSGVRSFSNVNMNMIDKTPNNVVLLLDGLPEQLAVVLHQSPAEQPLLVANSWVCESTDVFVV